ncbi:MAG: MFS transporter [Elusimicrobia bacterium]|nr:MFS transporter [Elusimicrobiota bacterium]
MSCDRPLSSPVRSGTPAPEPPGAGRLTLFFAVNYFAQGMLGIVFEPLSYLLKDDLGLSAGQSAVFVAWITFPFLIKPLFGLLTDMFAWKGLRRMPHIALASALPTAALLGLAAASRHRYWWLLAGMAAVNAGVVLADVICDGVMVERGKATESTGFYQAVQIGTLYSTLVLTGIGGGWLTAHVPMRWIFAMAAAFPAMILVSSLFVVDLPSAQPARNATQALAMLVKEKRFWTLSLVILLWNFNPFLGTAQFYYQTGHLGLGPKFIGLLSTAGGVAGVLGAACYGRLEGRLWSVGAIARSAVWFGAPLSLLYLFYQGPVSAILLTVLFGLTGVFFRLSFMDLAARSCPGFAEATAFAAFMSVFNISAYVSNTVGGKLYDVLSAGAGSYPAAAVLMLIGSACTALCWPLVRSLSPSS